MLSPREFATLILIKDAPDQVELDRAEYGLPIFALLYGLDWIATVPLTVRLATDVFGKERAPIIFGWVVAGHQLGAAFAAFGAGLLRSSIGTYTVASMIEGGRCLIASFLVLRINRGPRTVGVQTA